MTLDQIEKLTLKFLSRTIDKNELYLLTAWIDESDENRKYLQDYVNLNHAVNALHDPGSVDTDNALNEILKKINDKPAPKIRFVETWRKIASILIIPLLGWSMYVYVSSNKSNSQIPSYQEIVSPLGTKSNITLPDGSNVWLNSGSKLKFPLKFPSGTRNVFLAGEGFFKVKSDKKHPFIVHTNSLSVEATGTEFNVDAYSNDSITNVSLEEGVVDIMIGQKYIARMVPDQNLVFNNTYKSYSVTTVNASNICAWKDGILVFRDEPLENVFKRISRTYNVQIEVKDKMVARQLYRATFEKESLDEILKLLQISAPIKYKRSTREINADDQFNKERIEVLRK